MTRWEYKIVDSNDVAGGGMFKEKSREDLEKHLNTLGAEGWEIVNLDSREMEGRRSFIAVAKRPA